MADVDKLAVDKLGVDKLMKVEQLTPVGAAGQKAYFAEGEKGRYGDNAGNNSKDCWYCGKTGIKANCHKKAQDVGRKGGRA